MVKAYNNVFTFVCNEPRDCSASYTFVSRGLPTCKMLIRINVYSFLTCIVRSGNAILQSSSVYFTTGSPLAGNVLWQGMSFPSVVSCSYRFPLGNGLPPCALLWNVFDLFTLA